MISFQNNQLHVYVVFKVNMYEFT